MNWKDLQKEMCGRADKDYTAFSLPLAKTKYKMLGVRLPILKGIAKRERIHATKLLNEAVFDTFEDVMLFGFLINLESSNTNQFFERIEKFLNVADSWSHIDSVTASLKRIKSLRTEFLQTFIPLAKHTKTFHKRFLVVALLNYFLDDEYFMQTLGIVQTVEDGDYYVDMALAWLLSVAMSKNFELTMTKITQGSYSNSVIKKALQKGIESERIDVQSKQILKNMRKKVLLHIESN